VPQAPQGGGGLEAGARWRTTPVLGAHASIRRRLAVPRECLEYVQAQSKTVLMTAQMLHFLRRNPDGPEIALWIHLHQVFGYLDSLVALSRLFLLLVDGEP